MDAQQPQKGEENPGQIVVDCPFMKADIRVPVHRWNKKEIHQPPDQEESQGKKIESTGDGPAIIKTMGANKTEDPQEIANYFKTSLSC